MNPIENKLKNIRLLPTVVDNVHESLYRSYSILGLVKEMVYRWDSNESIKMIIGLLESEKPVFNQKLTKSE